MGIYVHIYDYIMYIYLYTCISLPRYVDVFPGANVDISSNGTLMAIGNTAGSTSSMKLYNWTTTWEPITIDTAGTTLALPASVSMSADASRIAVGVCDHPAGFVEIYDYDGSYTHTIQIGNSAQFGNTPGNANYTSVFFGYAISLSADGSTLAIGDEYYQNGPAGFDIGGVWIFRDNGTYWNQEHHVHPTPSAVGHILQGSSVHLNHNGSRLLIGSRFTNGNLAVWDKGVIWTHTYNFSYSVADPDISVANCFKSLSLTHPYLQDTCAKRTSMSTSGQYIAYTYDIHHIHVYSYSGATWTQLPVYTIPPPHEGVIDWVTVQIDDVPSMLVAYGTSYGLQSHSTTELLILSDENWTEWTSPVNYTITSMNATFGYSSAIYKNTTGHHTTEDDRLFIGNSTHIKVFRWGGDAPTAPPTPAPTPQKELIPQTYDGHTVALSGDGLVMAIGLVGAAQWYEWNGTWVHRATYNHTPSVTSIPQSTASVSLSHNGSRLAVGFTYEDTEKVVFDSQEAPGSPYGNGDLTKTFGNVTIYEWGEDDYIATFGGSTGTVTGHVNSYFFTEPYSEVYSNPGHITYAFGKHVSLSGDGQTVAISDTMFNPWVEGYCISSTTGICKVNHIHPQTNFWYNYDDFQSKLQTSGCEVCITGAAWVFKQNGSSWDQVGVGQCQSPSFPSTNAIAPSYVPQAGHIRWDSGHQFTGTNVNLNYDGTQLSLGSDYAYGGVHVLSYNITNICASTNEHRDMCGDHSYGYPNVLCSWTDMGGDYIGGANTGWPYVNSSTSQNTNTSGYGVSMTEDGAYMAFVHEISANEIEVAVHKHNASGWYNIQSVTYGNHSGSPNFTSPAPIELRHAPNGSLYLMIGHRMPHYGEVEIWEMEVGTGSTLWKPPIATYHHNVSSYGTHVAMHMGGPTGMNKNSDCHAFSDGTEVQVYRWGIPGMPTPPPGPTPPGPTPGPPGPSPGPPGPTPTTPSPTTPSPGPGPGPGPTTPSPTTPGPTTPSPTTPSPTTPPPTFATPSPTPVAPPSLAPTRSPTEKPSDDGTDIGVTIIGITLLVLFISTGIALMIYQIVKVTECCLKCRKRAIITNADGKVVDRHKGTVGTVDTVDTGGDEFTENSPFIRRRRSVRALV